MTNRYRTMYRRPQLIPMTNDSYDTQLNTVYQIAIDNRYEWDTIDKLFRQNNIILKTDEQTIGNYRWTGLTYIGKKKTYWAANFLDECDIKTSFETTNNLGLTTRDSLGIYKLASNDCDRVHKGWIGRNLKDEIQRILYGISLHDGF